MLAGFCWLWLAKEIVDFGVRWNSVGSVRHNVSVMLPDDSTRTGDLTTAWDGSYRLTDMTGKTWLFRDFKMMSMPMKGQAASAFPYKMVLPFFFYCLGSLGALYYLGMRDKRS